MIFIVLFVILRILSNSFSSVFQKKLVGFGFNAFFINGISYIILSIFCIFAIKYFNFSNNSVFICAILTGILGALGNAAQIKALNLGELSILAPINSYKVLFSLVFSAILLKEYPNFLGLLGIILIPSIL